ncbi:hypothetical protein Tco_1282855 [Tanacetum coccineum]
MSLFSDTGNASKTSSECTAGFNSKVLDGGIVMKKELFGWSPEPPAGQTVWRTSRKPVLPSKYNDYVLNRNVNYANLSIDNFMFTTNLNKIQEPATYLEAVKDSRWIDAMNQEMEALNRNKT